MTDTAVTSPGARPPRTVGLAVWAREGAANDVDDVVAQCRAAYDLGVRAVWFRQRFDADPLVLATAVAVTVPGLSLGTSVIPINPRHPIVLAAQASTVQAAAHGRFTLGVGLGATEEERVVYGIHRARQIDHLRQYLTALRSMIEQGTTDVENDLLVAKPPSKTHASGGTDVPVLVAAMGPRALRAAGELADGTLPLLAGPNTLRTQLVPAISEAAAGAGRPAPRVVAAVVAVVTDNTDRIRAEAQAQLSFFEQFASYRAQFANEGMDRAGQLAVIGTEDEVRAGLQAYFEAGATEVLVTHTHMGGPADQERTHALIGSMNSD